jgi:hypothetical protein
MSGPTVTIEFDAEVVDADFDACSVTLRSGVVHRGDVLIGADGASGFIRQRLLEEEGDPEDDELNGLAVYRLRHAFISLNCRTMIRLQCNYSQDACYRRFGIEKTVRVSSGMSFCNCVSSILSMPT